MGQRNTERLMKTTENPTFDNQVTLSQGATITAGGLTITAGGLTATAGGLTATAGDVTITAGFLNLGTPTELTIATGAVTATQTRHYIDTEGDAASDDLDTISGGTDGDVLILMAANDGRTVNVTAAGNIVAGANPRALDASEDTLTLMYDGALTKWVEISFITNAT